MNELEKMPLEVGEKQKFTRYISRNARTFIIVFILFAVVVVMTTDIRFVTAADISELGSDFFLLLFCSYAMYITCVDSGSRGGENAEAYHNAKGRFNGLKKRIIESDMQGRLHEFCNHYIDEDLKSARLYYLAVAGISYSEYIEKYANLSKKCVDNLPSLTDKQKSAIKKANNVKPIKFTPEMILGEQGSSRRRLLLGLTPNTKKNIAFGTKFVKMSLVAICMSIIAFDVILEPSWVVFASVCIKLVTVVMNGFSGYQEGFANIAVDTVNYVNNQSDFMVMAIQYIEAHPKLTTETTTTND